jgi:hypothetical protein
VKFTVYGQHRVINRIEHAHVDAGMRYTENTLEKSALKSDRNMGLWDGVNPIGIVVCNHRLVRRQAHETEMGFG